MALVGAGTLIVVKFSGIVCRSREILLVLGGSGGLCPVCGG